MAVVGEYGHKNRTKEKGTKKKSSTGNWYNSKPLKKWKSKSQQCCIVLLLFRIVIELYIGTIDYQFHAVSSK